MKIILDEGVPEPLGRYLFAQKVTSVNRLDWKSMRNGKLLAAIEEKGFEAFITNDKRNGARAEPRPPAVLRLVTQHKPLAYA